MIVVGFFNTFAAVIFAGALCWRLDKVRREGGGLQPLAMTVAISALTLAYVVSNHSVTEAIDTVLFTGAERTMFYALLAIGVAALVVVFFFPGRSTTRERRAGIEAVPLVVAIIGLQVTMLVIPSGLRTQRISDWTVNNIAFAVFVLIASGYLAYGFFACVRSVRQFFRLAEGYLRASLGLLLFGLGLLGLSSVVQILFVVGSAGKLFLAPWLLNFSQVMSVVGVVAFLVGICLPMLNSRWRSITARRRHRRNAEQLLPLWQTVTRGVPEVVLPGTGPTSPSMLFHRRVVEIRDALTQLSPCLSEDFEYAPDEARADMIEEAVYHYTNGHRTGAVRDVLPGAGGDIDADAVPLLRLSRVIARRQSATAEASYH